MNDSVVLTNEGLIFGSCPASPHIYGHGLRSVRPRMAKRYTWVVWIDFPIRESAYTMTRVGKNDRFAISSKIRPDVVLGHVVSNNDGTWSVEKRAGKKLGEVYGTIDEAAKALS